MKLNFYSYNVLKFLILYLYLLQQVHDDASIHCGGKLYPVHKIVLSSCSDYFDEMFENTHGKYPIIVLKDVKKEAFESLLEYMYLGEVNVIQDKLSDLINAAESLKIKGLAIADEEPSQSKKSEKINSNKRKKERSPTPSYDDQIKTKHARMEEIQKPNSIANIDEIEAPITEENFDTEDEEHITTNKLKPKEEISKYSSKVSRISSFF